MAHRNIKTQKGSLDEKIQQQVFDGISSSTAKELIQKIYKLNKENVVGFRRENMASLLYRYYRDMTLVIENLHSVVAEDGSIFFVIGDNVTEAGNQKIQITSSKVLLEIGRKIGWELIETIPITVTQENRLHNKNGITNNDILAGLRKEIKSEPNFLGFETPPDGIS